MHRPAPRFLSAAVLAVSLAAAACTDRNPASAPDAAPATLPPPAMAMLACTVSVRDATLACAAPEAAVQAGVSAAVIGGEGTNVQLTSTGESYDGTSVFRADVTVANLMAQALGTSDGMNPSAEGVRVFFGSGPVATAGTGAVEVANADGEGFFTTAAQKFFRYDGILAPGDTSAAREWRFNVPSTVERFSFGVYVAAPVRAEAGWLSMSPVGPSLPVGDTLRMSAVARDLAGAAQGDALVTWTTANAEVVTVDAQGLLHGVSPGIATVTATSGGRTGRVRVHVHGGSPNVGQATTNVVSIQMERWTTASGVDSVLFRAPFTGPTPVLNMGVRLTRPLATARECRATEPIRTESGFEYQCGFAFSATAAGGAWRIDHVEVSYRVLDHADLVAAGAPGYVYITRRGEDRTAPALDSLVIETPIVHVPGRLSIRLRATDFGVGADRVNVWVRSQGNPRHQLQGYFVTQSGSTALFQVEWQVPQYYHGGTFSLDSVRVQDRNGNALTLSAAALASRGFATQFTVTGTTPDAAGPAITAFSFSPDAVAGNGAVPVTVTLSASEPSSESGVRFLDMEFQKVSDGTVRRCLLSGATHALARTMTCSLSFNAADVGAWRVRYIRAIDYMNNERLLFTAQVQAAGYPTDLTVTPP